MSSDDSEDEEKEEKDLFNQEYYRKEKARIIVEIKTFMAIFQQTMTEFFGLESQVKPRVNREMMDNFITSLVLSGPLYVFVFNILALSNQEDISKLQIIVQNANVSLQSL